MNSDPERLALSENEPLPSLDVLFQGHSFIKDLEAKLRRTSDAYAYVQHQLLNCQSAHQREYQSRLICQNQIHAEKQRHADTARKYQLLCQQHNVLLEDHQREKDILEMQKKLISELESVIEIYQATFNISIQAPSENAFNPGTVDASLPAIKPNDDIKHEHEEPAAEADAQRSLFNEMMPSPFALTGRNHHSHYDFEFMVESPAVQQPNAAEESAFLPVSPNLSSPYRTPLSRKLMPTVLPAIEELSPLDSRELDSGVSLGCNQFTLSALRNTSLPNAPTSERNYVVDTTSDATNPISRSDPVKSAPALSDTSSKRPAGKDSGKQRKRARKSNSLTITPAAKIG